MSNQLEEMPEVISFLNSEDPSVEIIAKAYNARDINMNIEFDKSKLFNKLGYTDSAIENFLKYKFRAQVINQVDTFLENPENNVELNLNNSYIDFIKSDNIIATVSHRKTRFETLDKFNDRLEFYQNLNKDELCYLGW